MTLPSLLRGTPKMEVERAPFLFVIPDVSVDRLVANREPAGPMQPARDLFGAPLPLEKLHDDREILRIELSITSRSPSTCTSLVRSNKGTVPAVVGRTVALNLTTDRAPVPPEESGDLGRPQALPSKHSDRISLF